MDPSFEDLVQEVVRIRGILMAQQIQLDAQAHQIRILNENKMGKVFAIPDNLLK